MTDSGEFVLVAITSKAQRKAVHDAIVAVGLEPVDGRVGSDGLLVLDGARVAVMAPLALGKQQLSPPVSALARREHDYSLSAELRKLRELREQGVLTDGEYNEVKAELLAAWQ